MTDKQLWEQAHAGAKKAEAIITIGWLYPDLGKFRLHEMRSALRDSLCAVQELERRATILHHSTPHQARDTRQD